MKSRMFRIFAIAALLGVASAYAQERATQTVNVPFSFRIGATLLPAGEYKVIQNVATGYVALAGMDTKDRGAALTTLVGPVKSDISKLIFHRYGDKYVLAQICSQADGYTRKFNTKKAEGELAKLAGTIEIALVDIQVE